MLLKVQPRLFFGVLTIWVTETPENQKQPSNVKRKLFESDPLFPNLKDTESQECVQFGLPERPTSSVQVFHWMKSLDMGTETQKTTLEQGLKGISRG
jgi:hypothetical protein